MMKTSLDREHTDSLKYRIGGTLRIRYGFTQESTLSRQPVPLLPGELVMLRDRHCRTRLTGLKFAALLYIFAFLFYISGPFRHAYVAHIIAVCSVIGTCRSSGIRAQLCLCVEPCGGRRRVRPRSGQSCQQSPQESTWIGRAECVVCIDE